MRTPLLVFSLCIFLLVPLQEASSDEYIVSISANQPRLASIVATLTPTGSELRMNEEGVFGLENGWATFVENIKVLDINDEELVLIPKDNSSWNIQDYLDGEVTLSYDVRLNHDQLTPPIKFGDEGAAYATDNVVMWSGRSLFIAGKLSNDITIKFELPDNWQVLTPWEQITSRLFSPRDTIDLQNSGFIAGTSYTKDFNIQNTSLKISLSGENTLKYKNRIEYLSSQYFKYYKDIFDSTSNLNMLIIATDRPHWGGEVMGNTISLAFGNEGDIPAGFDLPGLLVHMIGHEMFHLFYGTQVEEDEKNGAHFHWFNEGFSAEYVTYLSRVRLGDINEDDLISIMQTQYEKYQDMLNGELTLKVAGEEKYDKYDMVYSGGLIAALSLDFMIRDIYNGQKELSDLWTYLLEEYPTGSVPLTLSRLVASVDYLFGAEIANEFEKYFSSPDLIPFYKNAEFVGLMVSDGKLSKNEYATDKQKILWNGFIDRYQ